mgnify:CR=1 FL=1
MSSSFAFDSFSGLRNALSDTRATGSRFTGQTRQFIANTNSLDAERSELGGNLSQQTAQALSGPQGGNNFASTLGQNTRVGKVRQNLRNRGDAAMKNQQLKDRLSVAKLGMRKRERGLSALSSAAGIREGVNQADMQARSSIRSSRAGLFGTLAGAGLAMYTGRNKPEPTMTTSSSNSGAN